MRPHLARAINTRCWNMSRSLVSTCSYWSDSGVHNFEQYLEEFTFPFSACCVRF
jgi:hypothetical protein